MWILDDDRDCSLEVKLGGQGPAVIWSSRRGRRGKASNRSGGSASAGEMIDGRQRTQQGWRACFL